MQNPAAQIVIWLILVIALQAAMPLPALLLAGVLMLVASGLAPSRLRQMLRRTRWIMFSLLLIYAFATPGEQPLFDLFGAASPSEEGLADGGLQLARLSGMLAALSLLLNRLNQQELVGGLYSLAYPLRYFGGVRQRFAVRLALTLQYAESDMLRGNAGWRDGIREMFAARDSCPRAIELPRHAVMLSDVLGLAVAVCVLGLVLP